jgi:hypothetical protein
MTVFLGPAAPGAGGGQGSGGVTPAQLAAAVATIDAEIAEVAGEIPASARNAPQRWFHPGPVSNTGGYEIRIAFNETLILPANLAGFTINAPNPPAAPTSYQLAVSVGGVKSVIGTIAISAAGVVTLPECAAVTVNAGDFAELTPVGTPDAAWADVAWAMMMYRN